MPWKKVAVDDQRMQFVIRATSGRERITTLCREFGISRPTGYLWCRRYLEARSLGALAERSRRPLRSPSRTAAWKEQRVVAARRAEGWGAKKLHVVLRGEEQLVLPVRTIHAVGKVMRNQPYTFNGKTRFSNGIRFDKIEAIDQDEISKYLFFEIAPREGSLLRLTHTTQQVEVEA